MKAAAHFISASCLDEECVICGEPATHKVGEEIGHDDPNYIRHNLTAYLCCAHFKEIFGRASPCSVREASHWCVSMPAKALREAMEWANPDPTDVDAEETEVWIEWRDPWVADDGSPNEAGYYLWYAEYPGEGMIGPLGK